VTVDFYQSTTAAVDLSDTGEPATTVLAGTAPEGAMPMLAVASESMVVTLVSYDDSTGLATFPDTDGLTCRAVVPPNLRLAAARSPGARIPVTMTSGGGIGHAGGLSPSRRRVPEAIHHRPEQGLGQDQQHPGRVEREPHAPAVAAFDTPIRAGPNSSPSSPAQPPRRAR
jgi:hypothetical protein